MLGLMQREPLLTSAILRHAARFHANAEIISRITPDLATLHRQTYAQTEQRARKLMRVLRRLGAAPGERIGTLAWNNYRHVELYYATGGLGVVCNTVNPRLAPEDIAYIINHAEDRLLFAEIDFAPLIAKIAPLIEGCVKTLIFLCPPEAMPELTLPPGMALASYDALMAEADDDAEWGVFDENTANVLCYTSGTTGRPKGVLYSHRSTVLHAMAVNLGDNLGTRATDRLLPVVPMFHVNAWGAPYAAPMAGATLILPGRFLDPKSLVGLINAERATAATGVPTIWLAMLEYLRQTGETLPTLKRLGSGGAAPPPILFEGFDAMGITLQQGWGMTESSPLVTWNAETPYTETLTGDARLAQRLSQGRPIFGVDIRARGDGEIDAPRDGTTQGNLQFRGHWVAERYYKKDVPEREDGWFPTGDVGTIDAHGFIRLTDRTKDLIKSGGEWISSIELENIAVGHPAVSEAAVIAAAHPKWSERPLCLVTLREGAMACAEDIRAFFRGKTHDYAIPDKVLIVDQLPHGATGKLSKLTLRKAYGKYYEESGAF